MQDLPNRGEVVGAGLLVVTNDNTVIHRAFGWKDRIRDEGRRDVTDPVRSNGCFAPWVVAHEFGPSPDSERE